MTMLQHVRVSRSQLVDLCRSEMSPSFRFCHIDMYDVAYMLVYFNCENAIIVTADLRYVCKIVRLLHAPFLLAHVTLHKCVRDIWGAVAEWVRSLDWRPGSPGFESRCGPYSLRNFDNFVYPTLSVSFGGDAKSHRLTADLRGGTAETFNMFRRASAVLPPSHRMRGVTEALVRHKPQWHRHDRRGSVVVPSLIAVAPPKTVKTADLRGGKAETFNMFKTSTVPPRVGPIRSGVTAAPPRPPWHHTRTALAPPSPPCPPQ